MGSSCCILASASTSTAGSSPTIASPSTAEVGASCCNDPRASTAALGASPFSAASSSTAASASSGAVGASCSTEPSASAAASSTAASTSTAEVGASASTAASSTAASASTAEVGASACTAAFSTAASASTVEVGAFYSTDPCTSTAALGASTFSDASSSTAASASTAAVGASASTAFQPFDVFINHKGDDVKRTFATSLYLRLDNEGLRAFLDEPEMKPGYKFPDQIKHAIETASVHVAILSPNYAESKWCLDELVMMIDSKAPIIPVFYRVTPADVRYAKGKYGQDLKTLEGKRNDDGTPRYDSTTIKNWRNALGEVANFHGFELEVHNGQKLERELLDKVVKCLSRMVKTTDLYVAEYPKGLDDKLLEFENKVLLQQPQSGKPQIVGIMGLGGIGKTTFATHFFNSKKSDYPRSCFLFDIKDHAAKGSLHSLQREILKNLARLDQPINSLAEGKAMLIKHLKPSDALTRFHKPVDTLDAGKEMPTKHLESSKALIVLDDIDHENQVKAILPFETHDFLAGSLILVTSRDKGVLIRASVETQSIYELSGLDPQYSKELFCTHAFKQADPRQGFETLTDKFLESCNGLPLSLEVYGAHLYGKDKSEWEDELGSLPIELKGILRSCYDALNKEEEQPIFLDIACFLIGQNRDTAISIWDASGWKGRRGFQNLKDRCLVQVDSSNLIHMHEHLRDLGREIGEKSSPFRLWRWTETVIDDLTQQSPLMVRGLKMDRSDYNNYSYYVLGMRPKRLRILDTEDDVMDSILGMVESPHMERISTTGMVLPDILWLRWRNCPHSSLPSWMSVKNLRHLEVCNSHLNALWQTENQSQEVPLQLRLLDVSGCCELEELPSLETLTSLEEFHAIDCVKLNSIRGLEHCSKLRYLDVGGCSELEELPTMQTLTSLEEFNAYYCVKLNSIGGLEHCSKLRKLDVRGCCELRKLNVSGCSELEAMGMEKLTSLEEFHAIDCVKLNSIRGLSYCSKLRYLDVGGCSELERLPTMHGWTSLEEFNAYHCVKLNSISVSGLMHCSKLRKVDVRGCCEVRKLNVSKCSELKELWMQMLTSLEEFYAFDCVKLNSIMGWEHCSKLREINVAGCSELEELPTMQTLTSLEKFEASGCVKLNSIRELEHCSKLRHLHVHRCSELKELPKMQTSLEFFSAFDCVKLNSIRGLEHCSKLWYLDVSGCSELEKLPKMQTLTSLEEFYADGCVKLNSIRGLEQCAKLRYLHVGGWSELEELPTMQTLTSLEVFHAFHCVKLNSIRGLEQCSNLRVVNVCACSELEELPTMEALLSMEKFYAVGCLKLKRIRGIWQLRRLRVLNVRFCLELEEVEGVEQCTWLEELDVSGCPKLQCLLWE